MTQTLRQLFDDVSQGRLSQAEALEMIKAIKLQEQSETFGSVLLAPVWEASPAPPSTAIDAFADARRVVVLCGLPCIDAVALGASFPHDECLMLDAPGTTSIADRYRETALACFERIQSILRSKPAGRVLMQIAIADDEQHAPLGGLSALLKTATLENPQFLGQLIVVPAETGTPELGQYLGDDARSADSATQIRRTRGERQILRWQEVAATPEPEVVFDDRGVYLITGGRGALGLLFANEILTRTRDARVVLTGRGTLSAEQRAAFPNINGRLRYEQVDLGDFDQVRRLITAIQAEFHRLDGVLHCAGMVADQFILRKSVADFNAVLAPKVAGTVHLDRATQDVALEFFVLFSSIAGAMGNVGQADYAAANAFMDQFAALRNRHVAAKQRHGRTCSINWPLWQAGGMSIDDAGREFLRQSTGILPMQTATGLQAFHRSLALPGDQFLVVEGELATMRRALLAGRPIAPSPAIEPQGVTAVSLDPARLGEAAEAYLCRELSALLNVPAERIDPQAALEQYGMDSILAMKLTGQLEKSFGSLSKTLFFEYQTLRELASYFATHHAKAMTALATTTTTQMPAMAQQQSANARPTANRRSGRARRESDAAPENDPIAIIGLSGRYPEAIDLDAYWRNLRDAKDCIVEVPRERWDWREYYSEDRTQGGRHYSKWGGFIAGVDEFDPQFFNIAPKEAKTLDPQERLFLQHAWMAVEDAGYTRATLQVPQPEQDLPGQVGVYVGLMYSEYQLFAAEASARGHRIGIAGSAASIANRVSYALNLHGPSMTLDTMCSSSLTAIHLACQDLKQGRTSLAIAGGVNVSIHPNKYLALSAGQFISSDGHCQSFGDGGDGYIPGEGVGVVVLKRLSDARRDGDHIYGIIRGSSLNHGGKTNGYTVPNPNAQASAIRRALAESATDARHISYIEAHGTGTKLGDPIEIAALCKAFQHFTKENGFCELGSAKSNIGHCESAAGIAGLTKVLLQMQHGEIVPSLHSAQLNPHIDFAATPFVVNQSLKAWERPVIDGRTLPRMAGISSFGAGGANAHMIVEEAPAPEPVQSVVDGPVAIVLSARTAAQLQQKVRDLIDFMNTRMPSLDLAAMAYTLQVGREAMAERLGVVVSSPTELLETLRAYANGESNSANLYQGQAQRNKVAHALADPRQDIDPCIAGQNLAGLLELWVQGVELDWTRLLGETNGERTPRRISLPVYPFAKERHWIDVPAPAQKERNAGESRPLRLRGERLALLRRSSASGGGVAQAHVIVPAREPREIVFATAQPVVAAPAGRGKPAGITLAMPASLANDRPASIERAPVALSGMTATVQTNATSPARAIRLFDDGDGTFTIRVGTPAAGDSSNDLLRQLRKAMDRAAQESTLKTLMIRGPERCFVLGGREDVNEGIAQQLFAAIAAFPYPVIAVVQGDAVGPAFLFAALCDFMVCDEEVRCGFTDVQRGLVPAAAEEALFAERFGAAHAQEFLYSARIATGRELRDKGWTCPFVPGSRLDAHANELASALASKSQTALRLLKQHLASKVVEAAGALTIVDRTGNVADLESKTSLPRTIVRSWKEQSAIAWLPAIPAASATRGFTIDTPQPIALRSSVVTATLHPGGIALIRMEDRQAKNMFSDALAAGLSEAFEEIGASPACKVVVLTGYDNYFASGGTKESLLAIQSGRIKFTDSKIFQLPLDCPLPVIAAMQGHGIGAGCSLGMFADLVLLSEESRYMSPYMSYGFTPGAGATWSLPETIGHDLARESLLTAQPQTGLAMKARGLRLPVLPREAVLPAAMALAQQIARASREQLVALKEQFIAGAHARLEEIYRSELAMHEETFVGHAGALEQIERNFHQEADAAPDRVPPARVAIAAGDLLPVVTGTLRTLLANELQLGEGDIDADTQFIDLGLDSVSGVSWIRKINETYRTTIEATKVYSYPTLAQLSRYVKTEAEACGTLSVPVAEAEPAPVPRAAEPEKRNAGRRLTLVRPSTKRSDQRSTAAARTSERIAVIGMAGQFPKARNLDEYWQNIAEGRNCISQVPRHRWDVDAYYQPGDPVSGKTNSKWLGALDDYDLFDPLFFNISPTEAETMDPQHRLFLHACWHTIENAGYAARGLSGSKCGVFVGCASGDYHQISRPHQLSAQGFTGSATSILAARISYFLNLQGPCLSIDTACSSSLVAIAQACDSLRSGASDVALAGGVYVMSGPEMHIKTAQAGMLSPEGACFTFDQRANGFVPGEGVGVVMLKRLSDAERDDDIIYGLIEGWGINQDGRTNGITAPNPESQTRLEQDVYDRFHIDPSGIQLIEAHGTGTKLGDPIELDGLRDSFGKYTQNRGYCAIGSVKSNIGHCLTAAGIAGVLKLLLALQEKQLPPTINFERLNEHIDLTPSPFFVNDRLREWTPGPGARRLAAVSSFGFSGTNAHLVIGEAPAPRNPARAPAANLIVPLSARTADQLRQKARDLVAFLRKTPADLAEIAYTLQVGREPMDERLAFVVSSKEQLAETLQHIVDGEKPGGDVYQGQVRRNKETLSLFATDSDLQETIDKWIANRKLAKLAELWVKGLDLQWTALYGTVRPRRVRLPEYPFAKERYWIEAPKAVAPAAPVPAVLHPLLQRAWGAVRTRRSFHRSQQAAARVLSDPAATASISPPMKQTVGSVLATPVWQRADAGTDAATRVTEELAERHVIFCGLPKPANSQWRYLLLPKSPSATLAERYTDYALATAERIRSVLQVRPRSRVLMQIVVPDEPDAMLLAGLSALLKTAALEEPQFTGQLLLVSCDIDAGALGRLLDEEQRRGHDSVVRHGRDGREVLQWQEVWHEAAPPVAFQDGGVYVITGGMGGLGIRFANEILTRAQRTTVVLTGRSPLTAEQQAVLDGLPLHDGQAFYRQVDLTDFGSVQAFIARVTSDHGRIHGLLHCAGMIADRVLLKKSAAEFRQVLTPKVAGTVHLDRATAHLDLEFFVLFSSVASPLGNAGQADYAAANGFLDQFAAYRNRQVEVGLRCGRTRSINWPLWQDGGMRLDGASLELLQQTAGVLPMRTETGMNAFYRSLALPCDQLLVVEGLQPQLSTYLRQVGILTAAPESYQYANKAEEFYSDATSRASADFKEEYLTFAPFETRKPGFSMSRVFLNPGAYAEEMDDVLAKQREMRQVLFCGENFASLTSVLDFGCGHGTDVIQMGGLFPHLEVHGCTITKDQATLGNERIARKQLNGARVKIHHKDSSQGAFPSLYDLIFGIEVSFHIRNKAGLFGNINSALRGNGRVLLMDYVSNLPGSVDDPNVEVSIPTQREWARLTAQFQLEIDEIIDVSPQISNFLYDPHFQENLADLPEVSQKTLKNYANQSASLERGWLSYVLIKLKKNEQRSTEQLEEHNLHSIRNPIPYPIARDAMLARERVDYPPRAGAARTHETLSIIERRVAVNPPVVAEPARAVAADRAPVSLEQLQQQLKVILSAVLRIETSIIDIDQAFSEYGLDSFLGTELMIAVNKEYGTELSNMKVFDYPTVRELARFLQQELAKRPARARAAPDPMPAAIAPARVSAPAPRFALKRHRRLAPTSGVVRNAPDERIAIIGMSGRYPQAATLHEYWQNLAAGRNSIVEMPPSRWDADRYYDADPSRKDRSKSKWLGALDDIDCFDPLFFRLSPQEAEYIDPQHRLFLEESYKAFEDAGYSSATLGNTKCGVYLGISTNEYALLLAKHQSLSAAPVTSNGSAVAAARIAYYLNLKGPAISIDTACSSSLVAIHLACQALLRGETDMALAGGVTLWLTPESYLSMSQAGMFSASGQCQSFDDAADGIVVGDGVGAVVLKRLADAERDGDSIHGVILGSGINQDGRTNGITAPSVNSQIELERAVYAQHGIDPDTISYVETHGTGTKLGDPIELEALATVFKEKTSRKNFCALGAVKSNIGHTTSAAGVAGVHKVLLSLRHRTLVPSLHVTKHNSHFDFANSPFYISRETKPWDTPHGAPRRAAVSSFGFSGTNAHLVIEEYAAPASRPEPSGSVIVPLSARTPEQLRHRAHDLLDVLREAPADLLSVAYTLQVGREAMEERLAFVVSSAEQLAERLAAWLGGGANGAGANGGDLFRGRVEPDDESIGLISRDDDMQEAIEKWLVRGKLANLADLWIRGLSFDWNKLYGAVKPRRMSLPTYPFARERYWIDTKGDVDRELAEREFANQAIAFGGDLNAIEDIINRIGDDSIETGQAVEMLKMLV